MKARTKLEYRCDKSQEFDYGMCNWYTRYSRSFDMIVTADTEEECLRLMESFENAVEASGFQDTFESNIMPELDSKKNKWVGLVEIYISNEEVEWEKDTVKEIYKDWKESLKNKTVETKEEKEMVNVKNNVVVESVMETSYEDGTYWIEYSVDGKLGYEIVDSNYEMNEEELKETYQEKYNSDSEINSSLAKKHNVKDCSSQLAELIESCRQSENEMWFVEEDEIEEAEAEKIAEEV